MPGGPLRLTVVYNPKAGARGWSKGAVHERLRAAGHVPVMVSTRSDWRSALEEPADAVVAAGGDGTVHKVARALASTGRSLAILPLGTANNVARSFGHVPGSDPFARVHDWGEEERTLRIECARCGADSLPFLEVMGTGAFGRLLARDDGKKLPVPLATLMRARRQLLTEVMEGHPFEARAVVDGRTLDGRFVMLACLRLASFGPAIRLAPGQRPDAEALTVIGVRNDQREAFAWWLATGEGEVEDYLLGVGRRIELVAPGPVHADDRLFEDRGEEPLRVTVEPGARRVRVMI